MFSSSPDNLPLKSSKARISDRDKKDTGWDHRYYDSYRPASRRGNSSENRSPTRAEESEAVRHHSKKTWHQAKFSSKKTSQGDVSPILISSRGNPPDRSPLAASESDDKPPSTGHDPDHLTQMPSQQRKGTGIPTSSPTVDAEDEARESEAQSRGFYSPSRSRTSNAVTVAGYELKRRQDDGETDRSSKRSRGDENDRDRTANRPGNAEDDKPGGASDTYKRQCKNYMCMGYHTYENCDRPMICWGCRSTKHYWTKCPMTCTRCLAPRHTAAFCEDFNFSPSGSSRPRLCNPQPPTEPASLRAGKEPLDRAHKEHPLPTRPGKLVLPNHPPKKASEGARVRASHKVFDTDFSSAQPVPQQSGHPDKGASPTDRPSQGLQEPKQSSSPRSRTTSVSEQLTISTRAPDKLATPPPTQSNISPLDPRRQRGEALSPLVSPVQSLRMSPEPGGIPSSKPQVLAKPPSNPSQHRPFGFGVGPSQASVLQEQYQSPPSGPRELYVPPTSGWTESRPTRALSQREEETSSRAPTRDENPALPASTPNEYSASETLQARKKAFDEAERIDQKEHEEDLARKARLQDTEFEREVEKFFNQKKHDAVMARKAAVQKQADEHEQRLAELRRL